VDSIGAVLNSRLNFTSNIDFLIVKASRMLGYIRRIGKEFRDPYTLKTGRNNPERSDKYTIRYTRKQANKEWFYEECAKVNDEKNATRERTIQNNTRGVKNAYKLARAKGKEARRRGFNRG
jgi:hypothetical protein